MKIKTEQFLKQFNFLMKLQIKIPPKEIYDAQVLVEKVKEKNNFPFKLTLTLDYNDDDAGYYF